VTPAELIAARDEHRRAARIWTVTMLLALVAGFVTAIVGVIDAKGGHLLASVAAYLCAAWCWAEASREFERAVEFQRRCLR
jgi:hypothetical protein